MPTSSAVFTAITDAVIAFADDQGLTLRIVGKPFTQPTDLTELWLELSIAPNDYEATLSGDGIMRQGIVQVSVCGSPGCGITDMTDIADAMTALWPVATAFSNPVFVAESGAIVTAGGALVVDSSTAAVRVRRTPRHSSLLESSSKVELPVYFEYTS